MGWGLAGLKMLTEAHFLCGRFWPVKYAKLTLFLMRNQGSFVGSCVQDYRSQRAAVNIQWHTYLHKYTNCILISLHEQLGQLR